MNGAKVTLLVVGLLLVGGLVVAVVLISRAPEDAIEPVYEGQASVIAEWCENLEVGFTGKAGVPTSFGAIVGLALEGQLLEPAGPSTTDPAALELWRAEHPAFVTSAYLLALGSWPREVTLQRTAFRTVVSAAHAGRKVDPTYRNLAGAQLDEYRTAHCPS